MSISFHVDRSVEYHFSRDNPPLTSYTIEHPAEQVVILHADADYERIFTPEGWLRLIWKNNRKDGWSTVHYKKVDKITPIHWDDRDLLHFDERINIKSQPCYGLWLGSPNGPLSAVKKYSTAVFHPDAGCPVSFKPRELTEHVFRSSGVLLIRWFFEPITP